MKIKRSTIITSAIVVFLALLIPALSHASTNICNDILSGTPFASLCGWKFVPTAPTEINEYGICRDVGATTDATKNLFVPLNSYPEWSDFTSNPPASTTLNICSPGCSKIPISIILKSNSYTPSYPNAWTIGATNSGSGGQGSTTLDFNWSNGSVMQPLPSSAENYDPNIYAANDYYQNMPSHPIPVIPFNISAVITFSDGTSVSLDNIAPPDGKWHQLPGDWSQISSSNPVSSCGQGYLINGTINGGYAPGGIFDFSTIPTYDSGYIGMPAIQKFHAISNCEHFVGITNTDLYPQDSADTLDSSGTYNQTGWINNVNLFYGAYAQPVLWPFQSRQFINDANWNIPLTDYVASFHSGMVVEPTRLVTFNYTSTGSGSECFAYLPVNCETDLIPTHLQFGSVSGGTYSSVKVDFSNGTSQTVSNFSTSASWSTLPGDWTTVAGNFGCLPGDCSSPTAAAAQTSGFGVYLKHTDAINAECVDVNGSIDHKILTADYSFPLTVNSGYNVINITGSGVPDGDGTQNQNFYNMSALVSGFWGSQNLSQSLTEGIESYPACGAKLSYVSDQYYWQLDHVINSSYNNKYNPQYIVSPDTQYDLVTGGTGTYGCTPVYGYSYDTNYSYHEESPWFPIYDIISKQCQILTAGTPYSKYLVAPVYFGSTAGYPSDSYIINGVINDSGGQSYDLTTSHPNPSDPSYNTPGQSSTTVTYSCIDPRDFSSSPYWSSDVPVLQ